MKQCRKCKQVKSLAEFSDRARTRDGKFHICKDCQDLSYLPWNRGINITKAGYIYLVKAENGLVKIGIGENVERRIKSIQMQSPVKIDLVMFQRVANTYKIEHELHDRFKHLHSHGEWFRLTEADIEIARVAIGRVAQLIEDTLDTRARTEALLGAIPQEDTMMDERGNRKALPCPECGKDAHGKGFDGGTAYCEHCGQRLVINRHFDGVDEWLKPYWER